MPTTVLRIYCPTEAVLVNRPKPWTTIQPFVLKHKLNNYPDKDFVEQLIYDICNGYTIGYNGPQFYSYLVKNLVSASQQLKVIDAALAKDCEFR